MLTVSRSRLAHLSNHISDAKADELLKLRNIITSLTVEMSGGDDSDSGVDRLAIWLELMTDLVADLKELEPQGVNLISDHYDDLVKRARKRYA